MSSHRAETVETEAPLDPEELEQFITNTLHDRLAHMIADVEWRLGRFDELARRAGMDMTPPETPRSLVSVPDQDVVVHTAGQGTIYAEDINTGKHTVTGYTVTANSPAAGSIAWTSLHVVYNGVDYSIANGSTALRYTYFIKPASGTTATLVSSATKPNQATLGAGGALIFVNNGGTPASITEESYPSAIADGSVDSNAILAGAVNSAALAAGAVGTAAMQANSVNSTILANGAVGSANIANGAVIAAGLGAGAVQPVNLNILHHTLY